ncbi:unnamed protein product [marine sediment metagenome]|uniref:Uncharacterized protein n=1 Tax=marine sediment metagenome TaxID=412755 RepID=X0XPY4_9ZZZZ
MGQRSGSEASKLLRVIRTLAGPRPARTAAERLKMIEKIASGVESADNLFKNRNALRFDDTKPQRKRGSGRDRKDTGGRDREE